MQDTRGAPHPVRAQVLGWHLEQGQQPLAHWRAWALEPEAGPRAGELRVRKLVSRRLDLAVKVTGCPLSWAWDVIPIWEITAHLGLATEMKQSAGVAPAALGVTGTVWMC